MVLKQLGGALKAFEIALFCVRCRTYGEKLIEELLRA